MLNNPTPYFVTIVDGRPKNGQSPKEFMPVMLAPFSSEPLKTALGNTPELSYINDYGGRPSLIFDCSASECRKTVSGKK